MEDIGPDGIKRQRLDSAGNSSASRIQPQLPHYGAHRTAPATPQPVPLHNTPSYASMPLGAPSQYAQPLPPSPYPSADPRSAADQQQQYGHPTSGYNTPSRQSFAEAGGPPPIGRRENGPVAIPGRSPPDTVSQQQQQQPPQHSRPNTHHGQIPPPHPPPSQQPPHQHHHPQHPHAHPPPPGSVMRPINTEFGGQEFAQPYSAGPGGHPGELAPVDPGAGNTYMNQDAQQQPNGTYPPPPVPQQSPHGPQQHGMPPPPPASGPPHAHQQQPPPSHQPPSTPSTPAGPPPPFNWPEQHPMSGVAYSHNPPNHQAVQQQPVQQGQQQPSYQSQVQMNNNLMKRNARATQACENCRARKAKCDEGKPQCGHCKEVNAECKYKDLPPAKHERAQKELMDKYTSIKDDQERLSSRIESLEGNTKQMLGLLERLCNQAEMTGSYPQRPSSHRLEPSALSDHGSVNNAKQAGAERQFKASGVVQVPEPIPDRSGGPIIVAHKTGAHRLMEWKSIRRLLHDVSIDENYVMKLEEQKGVLHYYGKGQSQDQFDGTDHTDKPSSPASATAEFAANAPDTWGHDLGRPFLSDGNFYPEGNKEEHLGGLLPDGSLNLQGPVMYRLMNSYISNIHILHPFLHRVKLRRMFDRVWQQANPGVNPNNSPFSEPGLSSARPAKRKFSADLQSEPMTPGPTSAGPSSNKESPTEKRVCTAIVLLVMAMGKICEHDDPLPGAVPDQATPIPVQPKWSSHRSAKLSMKSESPGSSGSPIRESHSGVPSPASVGIGLVERGPSSSTTSITAHSGNTPHDPQPQKSMRSGDKNVDVIPGLAYYIRAVEILGIVHGGNQVSHAQAFILASLYTSQNGCVLESWAWLQNACRVARFLVREEYLAQEQANNPDGENIIKFVFFTALQLESDITAELDVQSSGIHQLHKDRILQDKPIGYPAMIADKANQIAMTFNIHSENAGWDTSKSRSTSSETINMFYSYQLSMRTMLNDIQEHLYPINGEIESSSQGHFDEQLNNWRTVLLPNLQWNDMDDPSTEINEARLRAKYYGARYIVHRPSLYFALHGMTEQDWPAGFWSDPKSERGVGIDDEDDDTFTGPPTSRLTTLQDWVLASCKKCISSAIQSTVAFDGLIKEARGPRKWRGRFVRRLKVTNIFGTAHAQFGNMLVLSATYNSYLSSLIDKNELEELLKRTIAFLKTHAAVSTTLHMDAIILTHIYDSIRKGNSLGKSNQTGPNQATDGMPGSEMSTPIQPHPTPVATVTGSFSSV